MRRDRRGDLFHLFRKPVHSTETEQRIQHHRSEHGWLGKSYYKVSDYSNAKIACNNALKIEAKTESDRILQKQAKELLADI